MTYCDKYFSQDDRYSLGAESITGRHYASIPVSNGIVDYEEYYEITPEQYETFLNDKAAAVEFVESCRRHERDDLLIEKPGSNRGTPV
jgi:hypothetical protein